MPFKYASFGSVSSGTLRTSDLLDAFASELRTLVSANYANLPPNDAYYEEGARLLAVLAEADAWLDAYDDDSDSDEESGSALVDEMIDCLSSYFAPPYGYFGTLEGDGADFGFWLSDGALDDFDGLRVSDTSEVPADYSGEVLHINDHGNASLYVADGKGRLTEIWSVV
jgi:hypothetical protein